MTEKLCNIDTVTELTEPKLNSLKINYNTIVFLEMFYRRIWIYLIFD